MNVVYAISLVVASLGGWSLNLIGLPGNWITLAVVAIYAFLVRDAGHWEIGWWSVAGVAALAVLGEVLEFAAGALGARKVGGSRRAAALGIAGSLVGGLTGVVVGLPVPFIGPVIAAVLFAAIGALVGAMLGELWKGRTMDQGLQVGKAAFQGRLLGTLAKLYAGFLMVVLVVVVTVW